MKAQHWPKQRKPIALIREMIRGGASTDEIVSELGVSPGHVQRVRKEMKDDKAKKDL